MAPNENPGAFLRNAAGEEMSCYAVAVGFFTISLAVGRGNAFASQVAPPLAHDPALLAALAFIAARILEAGNG